MQAERKTFDGQIENNSLALSPDEKLAAVSYSGMPQVVVYDLAGRNPPRVLSRFITPRNILFGPDGGYFYVSDSSLGEVVEIMRIKWRWRDGLPWERGHLAPRSLRMDAFYSSTTKPHRR